MNKRRSVNVFTCRFMKILQNGVGRYTSLNIQYDRRIYDCRLKSIITAPVMNIVSYVVKCISSN